ncbi:MAG TPA: prepilin-type N-terminal cleavage/methylation domain-containing protein [Guyparkeria sp.]|nr:prepilin-type N-terminal cleavage/methylation domain-containing protein [Guyparkeria sp.]
MNTTRRAMAGFTLVELMIALVLGLLVIAGVGSVFLANKDAYRTNEALAQVQDAARTSFEYLARDVRAAGVNFCGAARVDSVLNPGNGLLNLASVDDAIQGWSDIGDVPDTFGLPSSVPGKPVPGRPLIRVAGSRDAGLALADSTVARSQIELGSGAAVNTGNVLMLCDTNKAVIFQVTGMSGSVIEHAAGATGDDNAPGNDSTADTFLDDPTFAASSYLAVPTNYLWYVGENDAGGHSLYRHGLGAQGIETTEMVRGLKADDAGDWDVRYHVRGEDGFVDAAGVGSNWGLVDAVRLTITTQSRGIDPGNSARGAGTDRERLERTFTTTIAIRSRMDAS